MFGKKTFIGAIIILIIAYGYNLYTKKKEASPVIETRLGKIQGVVSTTRGGKTVYEYLGIPYARPPEGNLRFEPPQPAEPWQGLRDASAYGSECAQIMLITGNYAGKEDCLFLNVFTPKLRKGPLPVLVFLHGGAFVTGSGNAYRPGYFLDEDVILVSVNYRLAALGFLNTGDGVVRGNMGLKDQTMALRWVKENIASFGGDPKQVLLYGESAGAASTSLHLVSPMSEGLFSKAILQSGLFTGKWSIWPEPAKQAKRFAQKFGCTNETSRAMIDCMKDLDVRTLVDAHKEILLPLREQITIFVPTVESVKDKDAFLTEDPIQALKNGRIHKIPLLAGVNAQEGLLTSAVITGNQSKLDQANNEFNFWAGRMLYYPEEKSDITSKIRKFYFGETKNIATKDLVENYTNLFSDRIFFEPLHTFATHYKNHAPLRLYFYTHKGQFSLARILSASQKPYFTPTVNIILDILIRWVKENIFGWEIPHPGVCHADELPLFYDWPLGASIRDESSKDFAVSKMLVKTWTDFAKNDKSMKCQTVEWKTVDPNNKHLPFMRLDAQPRMIQEPFENRIKFWKSLGV